MGRPKKPLTVSTASPLLRNTSMFIYVTLDGGSCRVSINQGLVVTKKQSATVAWLSIV